MKHTLFILLLASCSTNLSGQTDVAKLKKPLPAWVYTKDDSIQKGILIGRSATTILIYPGKMSDYKNQLSQETISIDYESITMIKTKKIGGLLKGLAIGGGIGLFPVVFGQGGAFVAVLTFPVGFITGTIVGLTSKKKYVIDGDLRAFQKFIAKIKK